MEDLVGRVLAARYRLMRVLGKGGMGVVYEAVQLALGRRVAVKVLFDRDARALARFRQEALAAASILHPNVVSVTDFDAGGEGGPPFIAMELLSGRSLARLLAVEKPFSVGRAVAIAAQMLEGLGAAHAAGIVHRDVKPGNVFLVDLPGGHLLVKVLDFGIAKLLEDENRIRTTTGSFLGTPAYVAPEQFVGGKDIDARTDIHAVGLCLYEMLTGERAFRGDGRVDVATKILRTEAPRIERPDVPGELADVVARALAKDKGARWPTAGAMLDALRPWLGEPAAAAPRRSQSPGTRTLEARGDARASTRPRSASGPVRGARPFAIALVVTLLAGSAAAMYVVARHVRGESTTADVEAAPVPTTGPSVEDASTVQELEADAATENDNDNEEEASADASFSPPSASVAAPAQLYNFARLEIGDVDENEGREWIRKNAGPMRAACMHRPSCHDDTIVYASGSSNWAKLSPRRHRIPGCEGPSRWRADVCIERYVQAHPLPATVCTDASVEWKCEAHLVVFFY